MEILIETSIIVEYQDFKHCSDCIFDEKGCIDRLEELPSFLPNCQEVSCIYKMGKIEVIEVK